ncbi:MAG: Gfo/Idh/MocA family oxidoreductase [Proteobacteria bacterium]|nr:Gfo/Idh/MocA family oxidoreductase [Pseudomonadota bacterium]MBU1686735.1 Gfo/Idh/MocA family oxidoreductase [Pseudomonadota bacterium]
MNIALIGCGYWGKNYLRVLDELAETNLVEVVDQNPAVLAQVKNKYPLIQTSTDYTATLAKSNIDAVVVATTASTHLPIAEEAIRNGKHLLVEKPLTIDPADCLRLTERAEKAGVLLMVGHTFLYNDSVRKMKDILKEDASGEIYYLTARRNHLGTIREDVSALWDLAAHDIAIFTYLLDQEPLSLSAVGGCYLREGREDVCFMTLNYPGGVMGHIQVSWVDANKVREVIAITGKRRVLFNDLDSLESIRVFEKGISFDEGAESFGEFQYLLRDGNIFSPKVERKEPLKNQCLHFVHCIEDGSRPVSDGRNGTMVVRVLRAASESMRQHGKEVFIEKSA